MASGEAKPLITDEWPRINVARVKRLLADKAFTPTLFLIHIREVSGKPRQLLDKSWTVFMTAAVTHARRKGYTEHEYSAAFNVTTGEMRLP